MVTTLEKLRSGREAAVMDIRGGRGVRQRLGNLGVHMGDRVRVLRSGSLGGPVLIQVHGFEVGLGNGMASKIEVEAEPEE